MAAACGGKPSAASLSIGDPLWGRLLQVPAFGGSLHLTSLRFASADHYMFRTTLKTILAQIRPFAVEVGFHGKLQGTSIDVKIIKFMQKSDSSEHPLSLAKQGEKR